MHGGMRVVQAVTAGRAAPIIVPVMVRVVIVRVVMVALGKMTGGRTIACMAVGG